MRRIASPMVGGMLTAPLLSMLVVPAAYLLLRVLFVRIGSLSPGTGQSIVLRHAGQPVSGEVDCRTGRADWARGNRAAALYQLNFGSPET